jgi:hypothetical protein
MITQLIAMRLCLRHSLRRRRCCCFKILKISRLKILLLLAPFAAWPWRPWRCYQLPVTSYQLPVTAFAESGARRQYSQLSRGSACSSIAHHLLLSVWDGG